MNTKHKGISDVRKIELIKAGHLVLVDLPIAVKGNQSLAQEILNRIESISKNPDELKYLTDVVTLLIDKSKGKEIEVLYKGKVLTKQVLAKEFGIFLAPKPPKV